VTFENIFKSSFLETTASFSPLDMVLALGLAFVIGLFIFLVYKKTFSGLCIRQALASPSLPCP